ncbi:hypothetical protein LCGC14_2253790 [marine sediment metagenome]|uniref:Uncharacterized protein n=1 Tax=marine sediment metagenome TaxID=412755 RepID=A0A0F9FE88_9ZZZZ
MAKGKKRLDEEYQTIDKKDAEELIKSNDKEIKKYKRLLFISQLKKLRNDFLYVLIVTLMMGFALYAWFPKEFTFYRIIGLGFLWWLLFEELRMHQMFKNDS